MAYQIRCDEYILHDHRDDALVVFNPKCKLEANTAGEGSFTILSTHPYYGQLKKLKSIFEIRQDGQPIFRGRMTNDSRDFENQLEVDLEGVLAFTNDSIIPPFSFPEDFPDAADAANVVEYFLRWLIETVHNGQVQDWQKLYVGNVTVADSNNLIIRSSEKHMSTWEALKTKLFESELGGYLCIRYTSDKTYVDYLSNFELTNTQRITLAENLLDIQNESDATETYSAILPLGAESESEDGVKTTLTLESLEDGDLTDDLVKKGNFIYSRSAVELYGWKCVPVEESTWEDVTLVSNLKTKAIERLTGAMMFSNTITIKAVDLHFTDDEIQTIRVYRNILVDSPAHGVVGASYPLTKLEIDLENPQNTTITAGVTVRSLTDINSDRENNVNEKIESAKNELKQDVANTTNQLNQKIEGISGLNFYVKYSAYADGHVMTDTPQADTQYMGTYAATLSQNTAPTDYRLYTWVKIRGADGTNGTNGSPGAPGADGRTQYLHIKYSDDGQTFTANDGEDLGAWIGTLVDFVEADSTNFSDYTWKKFTEDVDGELEDIRTSITEQRTELINTANQIIMSALESYVETSNYEEFKQTVETQLSILADEITMKFTTTTEQITGVDGDLQAKFEQLYKYISFSGDTAITIGSGDNAITLELDNEKGIVFKKNGVQFGLWDGENFYTGNIVIAVNERAQFGNFAFIPRSDGSLSFLKVGG